MRHRFDQTRVARSTATSNSYGFASGDGSKFRSPAGTNMVGGNVVNRSGTITTFNADAP